MSVEDRAEDSPALTGRGIEEPLPYGHGSDGMGLWL